MKYTDSLDILLPLLCRLSFLPSFTSLSLKRLINVNGEIRPNFADGSTNERAIDNERNFVQNDVSSWLLLLLVVCPNARKCRKSKAARITTREHGDMKRDVASVPLSRFTYFTYRDVGNVRS